MCELDLLGLSPSSSVMSNVLCSCCLL